MDKSRCSTENWHWPRPSRSLLQSCQKRYFFYCMGPKEHPVSTPQTDSSSDSRSLLLFNHTFDRDFIIASGSKMVFLMARQCLMDLNIGLHIDQETLGMNDIAVNRPKCTNYIMRLKEQMHDFLVYIYDYIQTVINLKNDICIQEMLCPYIYDNVMSLQLLLKKLGYSEEIPCLGQSSSSIFSYHKFHIYLDISCHHIDLLLLLDKCWKSETYNFEKHILFFMSDLLSLSLKQFKTMNNAEYVTSAPFKCNCVKEIWALLIRLLDSIHDEDNRKGSFWTYANSLLDKVAQDSANCLPPSTGNLVAPQYFICKEPEIFKVLMTYHLVSLNTLGGYIVKENYVLVESILRHYITPDSSISETNLRTIILLVTPLVSKCWQPKSETTMILWEYFHRRLNSIFFTSNSTPHNLQIMAKTSSSWLLEVKTRLDDNVENADSWGLFLRLLGLYLSNSQQKQWHQLRGRIYSKFSPSKLHALTELGLYRLGSLFFMLCITADITEASMKLLNLVELVKPTDSLRRHIVFRIHLTLIRLHMEKGIDMESVSQPLRVELKRMSECWEPSSLSLMKEVIGELQSFVEMEKFIELSGHVFVDSWMIQYLSMCPESDVCQLIRILTCLARCIQHSNASVTSQNTKLIEAFCYHILPFILASTKCTETCELEAGFSFHLSFLTLQYPQPFSPVTIFCKFVNSVTINVQILHRYLHQLMANQEFMVVLEKMENYQGLIVRAWLRCMILSVDYREHSLSSLTQSVAKLPELIKLTANQNVSLVGEGDTLETFIKILANAGSSYSSLVSFYLARVETCLIRSNTSSVQSTIRIYTSAAAFVQHAPLLIYSRSPQTKLHGLLQSIMNNLLLPPSIYSVGTQLSAQTKAAVGETLYKFICGLVTLKPHTDPYINKCLTDLIVQYLPRLVPGQENTMQNFLRPGTLHHPILNCFVDIHQSNNEKIGQLILKVLSTNFITCKGKTQSNHSILALAIVKEVLKKFNYSPKIIYLLTECTMKNIFELVTFSESSSASHQQAMDILQAILNQTENTRKHQMDVLVEFVKKHLAFSAVYVFSLLERLARLDPKLVKQSLPQIEDLVKIVEQKRGVAFDRGLRSGLEKINKLTS